MTIAAVSYRLEMMIRKIFFIALIFAVTLTLWARSNRPTDEPVWTGAIDGFAYSPMQPGQSPGRAEFPSEAEIAADIAIMARHSQSIRTYSLDGSLAAIPSIAAEHELDVTVGVWLDEDLNANQARLARLRRTVSDASNVRGVILGNETLLMERLGAAELGAYLSAMRDELDVPVSTAEPWHIWLAHPELVEQVDFVAVHLLPYWEGVPAKNSVDLVHRRMRELTEAFPGVPIVIGEVGWPSHGRGRGVASASRQDAETFLRRFLASADIEGYEYFLMEAFDQPWKRADEGEVGAYWGLFDGNRQAKYAFEQTQIAIPEWRFLALLAAAFATLSFLLLTIDSRGMRWPGLALLATTTTAVGNAGVWSLHGYLQQYWTLGSALAAVVLFVGILAMVLLIFVEAHEWAEAGFKRLVRTGVDANRGANADCAPDRRARSPKVSIHLPAYQEPPAMLIETLTALAHLDYPDYEVIVVDNNTRDEALWRPVEACCGRLGSHFKFFHVSPLEGFKAGALNFALKETADDAEIIAIIDSDYCVEPDWLQRLTRPFGDAKTALVQAPQDYRDHGTRAFKTLCESEYRGFFKIGMVTRNERNAIIQHGTMTMIRARVLREVGGWAEWTITEDAELGLRVFEQGYEAFYTSESFGRGLTPDRFRDYRAQRFRWALGATQILRRHGKRLIGLEPCKLSLGQRFHYLTGWAAWLGDGLNLAFNIIAIAWSVLMVALPLEFFAPVAIFSSFVLALFLFKLAKMTCLYRSQVRASTLETVGAVWSGLSLVFIIGRAVLAGLAGQDASFVRTPKLVDEDSVQGALKCVKAEALLAVALLGSAFGVAVTGPFSTLDRSVWTLLLAVFAIPHIAAVSLSLLGTMPRRRQADAATEPQKIASSA